MNTKKLRKESFGEAIKSLEASRDQNLTFKYCLDLALEKVKQFREKYTLKENLFEDNNKPAGMRTPS